MDAKTLAEQHPHMRDADMPIAERIKAATERIANGHASMRVPVEATDPDIVLHDCRVLIERQAAELEALRDESANLKTVMIAAAEEIHAHWDAHCDADGYGPQNLMRRLEEGIPSQYGYTAGAFAALRAERDAMARLWPLFEKATKDYVFTAERAGEVAADMNTLRVAVERAARTGGGNG